ncbi:hypothetical protein D3C84_817060 [compost metagenome]
MIKLNDAEPFRVLDLITKDSGTFFALHRSLEHGSKSKAIENVVAQNQADAILSNKVFGNNERLRQTVGTFLHFITELYANLATVAQ